MDTSPEETVGPKAWLAIDESPGWFVLMDHATGFKKPRDILSEQDAYFVQSAVRSVFPRDTLKFVKAGNRKLLARKPVAPAE